MKMIEEIIPHIHMWQGVEDIAYEPLNGGFANHTYKVIAAGEAYVLRINSNQHEYLGLDRVRENEVMAKASELGIAPKVYLEESTREYLITRFMPGHALTQEEIHDPNMLLRVVDNLKKIHGLKEIKRRSSLFDLIDNYLKGANELKVIWPDELKGFLERVEQIRADRSRTAIETYCHNDYFTFNMIYDGQELKVIDWELSGYGDGFFDLATLSYSNKFSQEEEKFLLKSYFGFFEEEQLTTLHDMKFVCMVREAAWAMLYSGLKLNVVNQPMDYYAFVLYVMKRLREGFVTL